MALTSNLQKTVALSLSEGFGIPLPATYLESREHFLSENGVHVGSELLWDLEKPEFVRDTVQRSRDWVEYGVSEYERLLSAAQNNDSSLDELVSLWGNMFRALYHGALDHVIPFQSVTKRISELANLPLESELLFQILTPKDGKSWHYHHKHPILLHLAYTFRRCSSGLQIGTYDGYSKNWLDLHFLAGSLDEAVNPIVDPTRRDIAETLRDLNIPHSAYQGAPTRGENEEYFNTIRRALRSLGEDRITFAWRRETAHTEILSAAPEPSRERVDALLTVIAEALKLNEEIHYQVYKGLNILRLAAQLRREATVKLSLAFSTELENDINKYKFTTDTYRSE
jgi:hypothetical protein